MTRSALAWICAAVLVLAASVAAGCSDDGSAVRSETAGASAGAGSGSGSGSGSGPAFSEVTPEGGADSITVYSGQHQQTVAALVEDFHEATGIGVALRSGGEGELANQIIQEGDNSPADVFYAGNSPALEALERPRPARAGGPGHARAGARRLQRAQGRLGRRVGALVGARLRPRPGVQGPAAEAPDRSRRPRVEGPHRLLAERDRLPAADLDGGGRGRRGRRQDVARGHEVQRHHLRRQRGDHLGGQPRATSPPAWSSTTTGTACATRSGRRT